MSKNFDRCPQCGSQNFINQIGESEPTSHYGRISCGDCGRFLDWLRDPKLTIEVEERNKVILEILNFHDFKLSNWEHSFLRELLQERFLTPKQKHKINNITIKTLGRQVCALNDDQKTRQSGRVEEKYAAC